MKQQKSSAPPARTILVIDDDPGLAKLIARRLQRQGWEAHYTLTGNEALAWLSSKSADLALVDLKLPDITTKELISKMHLPFVVITGQGDERVAVEMMKSGALEYLVKDAEFLETMPAIVGRALEKIDRDGRLRQVEEALRREHAFSTAVLTTLGALVVVLDKQGKIQRVNRAFEETTGYAFAEVSGKHFIQLFVPQEERASAENVFQQLLSDTSHNQYDNQILTRTGARRAISWSNTIIRRSDAELEYIVATGIDVTERRALEREILQVSGREQRRIGQDLHDGVCQELTGIELMSQALEQQLAKKAPTLASQAARIASNIRQTISNTKNLARGLVPVALESNGIVAALEELAASLTAIYNANCQVVALEDLRVKDVAAGIHLYRMVQEAATNAIKHGRATLVTILLSPMADKWEIKIQDNGTGFPKEFLNSKGMGLRIMKYRSKMIGGTIEFANLAAGGAAVSCIFPGNL